MNPSPGIEADGEGMNLGIVLLGVVIISSGYRNPVPARRDCHRSTGGGFSRSCSFKAESEINRISHGSATQRSLCRLTPGCPVKALDHGLPCSMSTNAVSKAPPLFSTTSMTLLLLV